MWCLIELNLCWETNMAAVELYHYEPGCVPDENQVFNDCFDTIKYQLNGFLPSPPAKT